MAIVKNVEKRIWDIEGFDVVIKQADGRDMRGDRTGIPMYNYDRMAKNAMTVSEPNAAAPPLALRARSAAAARPG